MELTFRWYGPKEEKITLQQIRQIPGVTGVISTLYDTAPGDVWELDAILALKKEIEDAGLSLAGIESVNVHDAIKAGLPDRDKYIDNYIATLENLGKADIHLVCYNFMPVFDWTRTDLFHPLPDGSTALYYEKDLIQDDPRAHGPGTIFSKIFEQWTMTLPPAGSRSGWPAWTSCLRCTAL